MKKILLILLLIIAIIGVVFIFARKSFGKNAPEKIDSFETIHLRINGMRGTREYAIISDGDEAEVSLYKFFYANGKEECRLEKSVTVRTEEMVEIMNFCGFSGWDGFKGEHPKNVSDGDMFRLEAFINENEKIHAEGSANFPKGYREFVQKLDALLNSEK